MQDLATALNNCMLRDGTGNPTAAISFGSQDVTAMNSLTITNALADTASLTLSKAGSKLVLGRSSDGGLSFIIGSETVGGTALSIQNAGGTHSEIQLFATPSIKLLTADIVRWTLGGTGQMLVAAPTATVVPLVIGNDVAVSAGGNVKHGIAFASATNFGLFVGSGVPTISVAKGSLYLRTDGSSTSTRAYLATDAVGTWTAITTAA